MKPLGKEVIAKLEKTLDNAYLLIERMVEKDDPIEDTKVTALADAAVAKMVNDFTTLVHWVDLNEDVYLTTMLRLSVLLSRGNLSVDEQREVIILAAALGDRILMEEEDGLQ